MNTWIQFGIGLLPGLFAMIAIMIIKKAFRIRDIVAIVLVFSITLSSLCVGFPSGDKKRTRRNARDSQAFEEGNPEDLILFANALVLQDEYSEAREVIDEHSTEAGYGISHRIITARICALEGDYTRACGLYRYLQDKDVAGISDEETEAVYSQDINDTSANAINYLKSIGKDPKEYGYDDSVQNTKTYTTDEISSEVKKAINDQYDIDRDIVKCAEMVHEVLDYDFSSGTEKKYADFFEDLRKDNPEIAGCTCVRKAMIKAAVISGDYTIITKNLDKSSSYHELMVAAELYIRGLVDAKDFSDDYSSVSTQEFKKIKKLIEEIVRENSKNLDDQAAQELEDRAQALIDSLKDPVLGKIKAQLIEEIVNGDSNDKSKIYLELAKIEEYYDNPEATDQHISDAINSAQDSPDEQYSGAMRNILKIINNNDVDDLDDIKNISDYVDVVIDNSLTVDIEEQISPRGAETDDQSSGDNSYSSDELAQTIENYTSKQRFRIFINSVDTSAFPDIKTRVKITSDTAESTDELRSLLEIKDCNVPINDFSFSKIDFSGSDIILLCDVSLSMEEEIDDLKEAVKSFVNDRQDDENVAIYSFCGVLKDGTGFGVSDSALLDYAENMGIDYGTAMLDATMEVLPNFTKNNTRNNVIILLTDGCDNNPWDNERISSELAPAVAASGVTIYTVGLGNEVDLLYLETIASSCGGSSIYASDPQKLNDLFRMIHEQNDSIYEIDFTAEDTITGSNRLYEVMIPSESASAEKYYSLYSPAEDAENGTLGALNNLDITGINPRFIIKSDSYSPVSLKGSGFTETATVEVILKGTQNYTLTTQYVDAETISLTLPEDIAVDEYDVSVNIDGRSKTIKNGLIIYVAGSEVVTKYGPYKFTSLHKTTSGDRTEIEGMVTLNDWLHFNGKVILEGNLEYDGNISMTDTDGSLVTFNSSDATGIAKIFANQGWDVYLPKLGTFTLYNDPVHCVDDYEDYNVDDITNVAFTLVDIATFSTSAMHLYPNRFEFTTKTCKLDFPCMKEIIKTCNDAINPFEISSSFSCIVDKTTIGIVAELSFSLSTPELSYVNLLDQPFKLDGELEAKIDTFKSELEFSLDVGMKISESSFGVFFKTKWKGLLVDRIEIGMKVDSDMIPPIISTPVPIYLTNFSVFAEDIVEAISNRNYIGIVFGGTIGVRSEKISKVSLPIIGNPAILSIPDCTVKFRLFPFKIESTANLFLLEDIKLASAEIHMGVFNYTNSLLGFDSEEAFGVDAKLNAGFSWESDDKSLGLTNMGGVETSFTNLFMGLQLSGEFSYSFDWWLISGGSREINGDLAFGIYTPHFLDDYELILAARYVDSNGIVAGFFYYINLVDGSMGNHSERLT